MALIKLPTNVRLVWSLLQKSWLIILKIQKNHDKITTESTH